MERLEAFEKMLNDLKTQASYEADEMERLKTEVERNPRRIGSFSATGSFISSC